MILPVDGYGHGHEDRTVSDAQHKHQQHEQPERQGTQPALQFSRHNAISRDQQQDAPQPILADQSGQSGKCKSENSLARY